MSQTSSHKVLSFLVFHVHGLMVLSICQEMKVLRVIRTLVVDFYHRGRNFIGKRHCARIKAYSNVVVNV